MENKIKKNDFITEETMMSLKDIGYDGDEKIEVRQCSEWLEKKYPNSILRKGYYLFREDLLQKAYKKYPQNSFDLIYHNTSGNKNGTENSNDFYYDRREYVIKLAIKEIKIKWQNQQ